MRRKISALLASVALLGSALIGGQAADAATNPVNQPIHKATTHKPATLPGFDITIVPGSTIHLVSRNSKLPVSIQNNYNVEMRVQVHVEPTSLSAMIPDAVEVTIPANTTYVAQVPVTAIADGAVVLHAWLTTFSGLSLGIPVDLKLTINAEVEDSLIGGFAVLVAGLAVAGVVRTLRKRKSVKV